jgi:hypothetical protein
LPISVATREVEGGANFIPRQQKSEAFFPYSCCIGVHSTTSFTHTNGPPLGLKAEKGGVQMVYAEEERRSNYVPRKNYEKKV